MLPRFRALARVMPTAVRSRMRPFQSQRAVTCRTSPFVGLRASARRPVVAVRWASTGGGGGGHSEDSDDHFKPKRKQVPSGKEAILDLIDQQVKDNRIMLYMKGTPSAPQCGFSMNVVRILHAQGASFSSVNVLDYPEIREGIKEYSEWPTIPQVYLDGEFLGGSDVLTQLSQSGELKEMLQEKGLVA